MVLNVNTFAIKNMPRPVAAVAITTAGVTVAYGVSQAVPVLGALTVAVLIGVLVRNLGLVPVSARLGLAAATRRMLRAGVVVLGLQLSVAQVAGLGGPTLAVVVVTVVGTFGGTLLVGRLLRMRRESTLLVATGFSICGASAVAAVSEVARGDEEDTAVAVALVTIFGSLALAVEPLLRGPLGLTDAQFGIWAGASVHEVAQVVATAQVAGAAALGIAVVVKLTRVVLLAPLVAGIGLLDRARIPGGGASPAARPPAVPLFVLGFLGTAAFRSTGLVPDVVLHAGSVLATLLLAGALFGLGTAVDLPRLARTGGRALALGAASTFIAAGVSYGAIIALA